MAGRSREPGAESRTKRTSVRWTPEEYDTLERVRAERGFLYLTDVPRELTLKQIELQRIVGDSADALEEARKVTGKPPEEVATLALKQLRLEEEIGDASGLLEKVQQVLGLKSREEVIATLVRRQLELFGSTLEKVVTE